MPLLNDCTYSLDAVVALDRAFLDLGLVRGLD